jgi:erythritol transport system ATP-binding protein
MTVAVTQSNASEGQKEGFGDVILYAERITKLFPGVLALDQVNFKAYRGKVNVLVGENGAGKSTLMKILAGVEHPTSGRLLLEGEEVTFKSAREAARAGIGIIYQELNLFPNLNIAENIFMARELKKNGVICHSAQEEATRKILARLEQPIAARTLVSDLRMGQQQIVEIAKSLSQNVRILIMDEPTSALTSGETDALFRIIADLKGAGVTIIYISHKLEELLRIGDYVTVLRDGRLAAEAPVSAIDVPWIIQKMVGRKVRTAERKQHTPALAGDQILLTVEHLTLPRVSGGYTLEDVSFCVRRGEIVGIYGLMGAGRTELFECMIGLHPEATGLITLAGQVITDQSIGERIEMGLMLVPEDRQRLGLVQTLSIARNITLASLGRQLRAFLLSERKESRNVNREIRKLAIKTSAPSNPVTSLSGGNQQKVVVAKSLLTEPIMLLLDEPTRGIDVGAKAEIFEIMSRLANDGLGILFVSSELPEVLAVPDRIIVLSKGKITGEFAHEAATEQLLVAASAAGHKVDNSADEGQRAEARQRGPPRQSP